MASQALTRPRHDLPGPWRAHVIGWLVLAVLVALQQPGLTAADTKHDLTVDPGGFLARALNAWTDTFTLGQLQNQAYGYLFPQGLFFWLTDPFPAWLAQRAWWLLVLAVGYSGMLALLRRIGVRGTPAQVAGTVAFIAAPRVLTTLTAISSETWPVMLAPWVVFALLGRPGWRAGSAAAVPVALMGAVNATATLAACVPGAVVLLWRPIDDAASRRRLGATAATWAAGSVLVSLWWLVPLLVLGRYAPPFTDFIESAGVTTRWLNPAEILRGTTSWTPFVDTERRAGFALVSEPVFVVVTLAVAAAGLIGLRCARGKVRAPWLVMLACGLVMLGLGHGPLGDWWVGLLDGALAPLRNLHKFDPLVRLPLAVGVAFLVERLAAGRGLRGLRGLAPQRVAALVLIAGLLAASAAPALSGRLLPRGAYEEVPGYWPQAAAFLDGLETRTLVYPPSPFARQEWGWTRDEPVQPLAENPWAVRDAVPLVDPEAIRGLDGLDAALRADPGAAARALESFGVGAVLVRHDLDDPRARDDAAAVADLLPGEVHTFGEVEVHVLDAGAGMRLVDDEPVRVAGGGEVLPLLDAASGPAVRRLVPGDAEVVTDTPQLVARNYGEVRDATSAALAEPAEGADVRNPVPDYPSAGPRTRGVEHGGHVAASSSAAGPASLGGADPARSATAAVDGDPQTAWWPAPGRGAGEFLEVTPENPDGRLTVTATGDTTVEVTAGDRRLDVTLREGVPRTVHIGAGVPVRVELTERVGISELTAGVSREIEVPDTSPGVRAFFFQRLTPDPGAVRRVFTAPRQMTVTVRAAGGAEVLLDGRAVPRDATVDLEEGTHRVETDADWVELAEPGFTASPEQHVEALGGGAGGPVEVTAADRDRWLMTGRSANPGLRASVAGRELEPAVLDAGMQAFRVPAGVGGSVEFSFAGQPAYRAGLLGGGAVAVLTLLGLVLILVRGAGVPRTAPAVRTTVTTGTSSIGRRWTGFGVVALAAVLVAGVAGAVAAVVAWVVQRFTRIRPTWLVAGSLGAGAAWLERAPWPPGVHGLYAGDSALLAGAVLVAVLAAALPIEDGLLDERVRDAGDAQRDDERDGQHGPEAAGEGADAGQREDGAEHRDVPEEQ